MTIPVKKGGHSFLNRFSYSFILRGKSANRFKSAIKREDIWKFFHPKASHENERLFYLLIFNVLVDQAE